MYLTQKGGLLVCRHAHTLSTLRKMRKVRCYGIPAPSRGFRNGGMCDCELDDLPQRTGLKSLPKLSTLPGKFGEGRLASPVTRAAGSWRRERDSEQDSVTDA